MKSCTLRSLCVPIVGALLIAGAAFAQQPDTAAGRKPGSKPDDGTRAVTSPNQTLGNTGPQSGRPTRPGDTTPTNVQPGAANVAKGGASEQLDSTPILRFEPEELDLGEMAPDTPKTGVVKIFNISDKPITITRAIPSCGCTTPTWPKEPIPAGGSGEMEITLKAGAKAGVTLSKNVTLQVDGHAPIRYTLRGQVPEFVRIAPDIVEAPGTADRPVSNVVTFTAVDGTPFRVSNVSPAIAMAEDARNAAEKAATEHTIRVDWDKWTEAGRPFRVNFSTDHPKAATLAVMIRRPIQRTGDGTAADSNPLHTGNTPPRNPAAQRSLPTGIVFAAQRGDLEEVKRRLAAGDDPNAHDPQSMRTALHWAAKNNNVEIIDVLVAAGADIKVVERMGRAPLALAAESGSVDAMQHLLEAKADVNARDEHGGSPLLWAAGLGSPEAVQALLAAGADGNVQDTNGMTPLMWAATVGDPRNVVVLASANGVQVDATDKISGETALMRAARNGKVDAVRILVEKGAKVDAKSQQGMTPLLFACQTGNLDTVKALLAGKPNLTFKDPQGRNAADFAAARNEAEGKRIAEFLSSELKVQPTGTVASTPSTPTKGG